MNYTVARACRKIIGVIVDFFEHFRKTTNTLARRTRERLWSSMNGFMKYELPQRAPTLVFIEHPSVLCWPQ